MQLELVPGSEATAAGPDAKQAAKDGRIAMAQPKGLPRGKLRFRASDMYQEVLEEQFLPAGLEIQMDVASGKNMARLCRGGKVDYAGAKDNYPMVRDALRLAATQNNVERMRKLLATCFYDAQTMSSSLLEASAKGYADIVDALMAGGMSKADPVAVDATEGQSALHRAMMNGHEDICKKMIDVLPTAADARPLNKKLMDPFAAARDEDLGMVAKRMEKYISEHIFTGKDPRIVGAACASSSASATAQDSEKVSDRSSTGSASPSSSVGSWWMILLPAGVVLLGWVLQSHLRASK